jgi:hypothetical protein
VEIPPSYETFTYQFTAFSFGIREQIRLSAAHSPLHFSLLTIPFEVLFKVFWIVRPGARHAIECINDPANQ